VSASSHSVKPADQFLVLGAQVYFGEFDNGFMRLFCGWQIAFGIHERFAGPHHGMIRYGKGPRQVYGQI
jgi:hypothetical protein